LHGDQGGPGRSQPLTAQRHGQIERPGQTKTDDDEPDDAARIDARAELRMHEKLSDARLSGV
jgi:hypothetical protein